MSPRPSSPWCLGSCFGDVHELARALIEPDPERFRVSSGRREEVPPGCSSSLSSASPICHTTSSRSPGTLACSASMSRSSPCSSSDAFARVRDGVPETAAALAVTGSGFLSVRSTTPPMSTRMERKMAKRVQPLYASISLLKTSELRKPDAV